MNLVREIITRDKFSLFKYILACFLNLLASLSASLVLSILLSLLDTKNYNLLQPKIFIALALTIVPVFLMKLAGRIKISFIKEKMVDLRSSLFEGIINSDFETFNRKSRDEYLSYLTNDVNTFEKNYFTALEGLIVKTGLLIISLVIILFIDVKFFLIFSVYLLTLSFYNLFFKKKIVNLTKEISNLNTSYSIQLANLFSGLDIIKSNNVEDIFLNNAKKVYVDQEKKKGRYFFINGLQEIFMSRIATISTILALLYVSYRISTNDMTFSLASLVFIFVNVAVQNLSEIFPSYNKFMANDEIMNSRLLTSKVDTKSSKGVNFIFNERIDIKDLTFSYKEKNVLDNINFSIQKGKKYLVKGNSGAGKSTLLNIMLSFLNNYEGSIEFDGVSLKTIDREDYYRQIGIISQEVFLFEASLRDNISLFREYSDEEIANAIKIANLTKFVNSLPNGLDTIIIDNGKEISGGERQRIAIAMAVIKKPSIIFADEITSSLNEDIAVEIERELLKLNCTIISISHRIYEETKNLYDGIIEIEKGRIKVYGVLSHD